MDTLVSLAGQFPLLGSARDLHPLADIHASRTKNPRCRSTGDNYLESEYSFTCKVRLLYVNDSQTVRSVALNTLAFSLVNCNTLSLQVSSYAVSTLLRQAVVDSLRTLWRSSTSDSNVLATSDVVKSLLSLLGESRLALSECYEYEVRNVNLLSRSLLNDFLNNLLRLLSKLSLQVVDLVVKTIDLGLVAETNK